MGGLSGEFLCSFCFCAKLDQHESLAIGITALGDTRQGIGCGVLDTGALIWEGVEICVGPRRSLSGPDRGPRSLCAGPRRSPCRAPVLCVGPRRSLRLGPVLSVLGSGALCRALCVGPGALCVRARRSLCQASALSVSGPGALCVGPGWLCGASPLSCCLRHSLCRCRGPTLSVSPPIRSAGPQLRSVCHPSSQARSLFPGGNPKPYC